MMQKSGLATSEVGAAKPKPVKKIVHFKVSTFKNPSTIFFDTIKAYTYTPFIKVTYATNIPK